MTLFDKYAKLRKTLGSGSLYVDRAKILEFLEGRVKRQDLPALVVEPTTVTGVQACVQFAVERKLSMAICSGLAGKGADDLGGKMLLSTARFVSAPAFLDGNSRVQVAAGMSLEALNLDLNRHKVRWPPLFPVAKTASIGALVASGWQGLRNWRHGGTISHIGALEWVDGAGNLREAGTRLQGGDPADVLPLLFGSRGELGILTNIELLLEEKPQQRIASTIHLSEVAEVTAVLSQIGMSSPAPEIVLLFDAGALEILGKTPSAAANERTRAMVVCEWRDSPPEKMRTLPHTRWFETAEEVDKLWASLLELVPVAAKRCPAHMEGQVVLPARAFADFEAYTRAVSHEANISAALAGTVEVGHMHIWLFLSEDEPRLKRRANDVLEKMQDYSAQLGGGPAGKIAPGILKRLALQRDSWTTGWRVCAKLKERLDPHGIFPIREPLAQRVLP
ncbi:MAG: FAD-binding oxidoreductase [bacterium]